MKLTLSYPPSANDYWRSVRGRVLVSREARAYRERARLEALSQRIGRPLEGPVFVSVAVYRPRRIGDLDNRLKVMLDALRGVAYEDDDQVVEIHAMRFEDKANPRVEVEVEPSSLMQRVVTR